MIDAVVELETQNLVLLWVFVVVQVLVPVAIIMIAWRKIKHKLIPRDVKLFSLIVFLLFFLILFINIFLKR